MSIRTLAAGLLLLGAPLLHAQDATPSGPSESSGHEPIPTAELDPGRTVLTIDGTPIDAATYIQWLMRMRGELIADEYVTAWIVERAAQQAGVNISHAEIWAEVEEEVEGRVRNTFGGKRDAWVRSLQRLGRSEVGHLTQRYVVLRHEELARKLASIGRVVPEEKIVREWERMYGRGGRRPQVRMIKLAFLSPPVPAGLKTDERLKIVEAARAELLEEAREVRLRLLGGEDFGKLARELSDDSGSKFSGGYPADGFREELWPSTVHDTLAGMNEGEICEPIFARGGYWILQLTTLVVTPLEQVREEIVADLIERGPESDEIIAKVAELTEGVEWEILPAMTMLPDEGERTRPANEVVMVIDGVPIQRGEYERWLLHMQGELMHHRFAEAWQVERLAREKKVTVTPEEIEQRVEDDIERDIERDYEGLEERWILGVSGTGRTPEMWRRETAVRTRTNLAAEKMYLQQLVVSDRDVRNEWLARYGERGMLIHARVLRMDIPLAEPEEGSARRGMVGDEEATEKVRAELASMRQSVLEGDADFAALAKEHSDDEDTRAAGGLVEGGFLPEQWPSSLSTHVTPLEPGQVTEPVQVGNSFYLVQVTGLEEVPFDSVEDRIREELKTRRPPFTEIAVYKNVLTRELKLETQPGMFL